MTRPELDDRDSQPDHHTPPQHPAGCVNGWLPAPDQDHPRPCPTCKPWLVGHKTRLGAPSPRRTT